MERLSVPASSAEGKINPGTAWPEQGTPYAHAGGWTATHAQDARTLNAPP